MPAAGLVSSNGARNLRAETLRAEAEARSHEQRLGIRLTYLDGALPLDRVLLEVLRKGLPRLIVLDYRKDYDEED